jgi:hypothetical protein
MAGGPVLIYVIRTLITEYYNYRIDSLTSQLKVQQAERAKTIQKLKDATKYDSTLELLEKYGGAEGKPSRGKKGASAEDESQDKTPAGKGGGKLPNRTNMPPPPTANIPRGDTRSPVSMPTSPQPPAGPAPLPLSPEIPTAEFAPNAFGPGSTGIPPSANYAMPSNGGNIGEPHWYDRILDLLLGEDEMAAKNRIVLICSNCRLVNGQAPPGTKSLAELGMWKCMSCGAANGEMDEGRRIVKEVLGNKKAAEKLAAKVTPETSADGYEDSSDLVEVHTEEGEEDGSTGDESITGSAEPEPEQIKKPAKAVRRSGRKKTGK